ncbi:MAG: sigma-70 family RNA polymerase sigma factor [Isosphaeraceae bacterium]
MVDFDSMEPDLLLRKAARGDEKARQRLLALHRPSLQRMVAVRLDPRLSARLDPSDVVQEALVVAAGRLDEFLRDRPVPFLAWLRQIAQDRLADAYRQHVRCEKRTVSREQPLGTLLPDDSVGVLARRFVASGTSPSRRMASREQREWVRAALARLSPSDREFLVIRYIEGLGISEIARLLGLSESAAKMRQLRALERLRKLLESDPSQGNFWP